MAFDIVFGCLLLFGAWHGLRTGFAKILLNLTGILLGVVFAQPLSKFAVEQFGDRIESVPVEIRPSAAFMAALVVIWLGFWTIGSIFLSWYRKKVFGENVPSLPDRLLGIGLGVAEAAFVVSFLVGCWTFVPEGLRQNSTVLAHYQASKAIQAAGEYPFAEEVLHTEEVRRVKEHFRELLRHYRKSTASTADRSRDSEFDVR